MTTREGWVLVILALLLAPGCASTTTGPRSGAAPLLAEAPQPAEAPRPSEAPQPASSPVAPSRGLFDSQPAGPAEVGGAKDMPFGVTAGIRPWVFIERTDLPEDLELDGPMGYELGLFVADQAQGRVSLTYIPLEEQDSDRNVGAYWLDWSGGQSYSLWGGPLFGALRYEIGPSLLFMDFERSTYDTVALGGLARAILGVYFSRPAMGIELSGDVHGWLGADSHDPQAAWAATLGINVTVKF